MVEQDIQLELFDSIKNQFIEPVTNLKSFNNINILSSKYQEAFKKSLTLCEGINKDILVSKLDLVLRIIDIF